MGRIAGVLFLVGTILSVSARAQPEGEVRQRVDWFNNYMEFEVVSPRPSGISDAEALVRAMLHGRTLAYGQALERIEGLAVMGKIRADARRIKDIASFGAGRSELPLPGIALKSIGEIRARDGSRLYTLTYQTPLAGKGSVLSSIWPNVRQEVEADPPAQFQAPEASPAPSATFDPNARYTGLAVRLGDFRGELFPVVSVLSESGEEVYGALKASTQFVAEQGMVGYARSLDEPASIRDRIGANPLVVTAIRVENGNPVVSEADAARIVYADNQSGFLATCRVAFLVGGR